MHADITKTQASEYLRFAIFQDANWDFSTFDFDSAMLLADRIDDGVTKAMDPNLQAFFLRGGKLLQYHGWSDPQSRLLTASTTTPASRILWDVKPMYLTLIVSS